jgi:hypothetical protein
MATSRGGIAARLWLAFGTGGQGVGPLPVLTDSVTVTEKSDGSVRSRSGWLVNPMWLLYATGGAAWQKDQVNATCNGSHK